jgi:glutathione S-transferase
MTVTDLKLYGGMVSPFVLRPVMVARAKGHDLPVESFPGGIKSPEYLALSPIGKMPLLVHGDFALPESQPITDYLDTILPGPSMIPADPQAAARVRLLVRLADVYFVPNLTTLFRGRETPEVLPAALKGLAEALSHMEHFRNAADSHAVGDSFTQADAALIPLFFFLEALDAGLGTARLLEDVPGLSAWWTNAKASSLGSRVLAEQGEAMRAMMAARAAASN